MTRRWMIAEAPDKEILHLASALEIHPLLARCLWLRGQKEPSAARSFLNPRLRELGDPFELPDMETATRRLFQARANREPVVVFGDYDVDGVTATALLLEFLRDHGWIVAAYLPHRLDEGYGLSPDGVDNCLELHPCKLLLAVDCGSASAEAIAKLHTSGIDTIVLDHHQIGSPEPQPRAFVNPQRMAHGSSLRDLCSAGLAFKLIHALVKEGRQAEDARFAQSDVRQALDLVALGTVADLVNLSRENRILVAHGLERLRQSERPGLKALMQVAGVRSTIGVSEVAFQLAPRLNAAGRIEKAGAALDLLMSSESPKALELATALDECNQERQRIEKNIASEALESARQSVQDGHPWFIVVGRSDWHLGVVGIVASRVLREFHRPTIVLGGDGDHWRGSGRSIDGFDLSQALRDCSDLMVRCGGHAMAAGLTIAPGNVDSLRRRLNEIAQQRLQPEQWIPALAIDGEATSEEITLENLEQLARLEPFGQGNPPVRLYFRGIRITRGPTRVGRENQHLKFQVTDRFGRPLDAIWWNGPSSIPTEGLLDLAFTPSINEYQGRRTPQLTVADLRPSEPTVPRGS